MPDPTRPVGPRIISIVNQKGGVGKTTTAINLATALAAIGEEVLIIDIDPQGNASTGLGIDRRDRTSSSYDILTNGASVSDTAMPTVVPHLSIVPSTMDLLGVELEIANEKDRIYRLKKAVRADDARKYSYILIDCPPSLNLLTMNAMHSVHRQKIERWRTIYQNIGIFSCIICSNSLLQAVYPVFFIGDFQFHTQKIHRRWNDREMRHNRRHCGVRHRSPICQNIVRRRSSIASVNAQPGAGVALRIDINNKNLFTNRSECGG